MSSQMNEDLLEVFLSTNQAVLPSKGSSGAAGYDISSAEDIVVAARSHCKVSTGIHIAFPVGYYGRVAPRSGLAFKHGLNVGAGVIDHDYRGEIGVILFNHTDKDYQINKGDRIAQLILEKYADNVPVKQVKTLEELGKTQRGHGGFGSTGLTTDDVVNLPLFLTPEQIKNGWGMNL